jgi:hypothetical protein
VEAREAPAIAGAKAPGAKAPAIAGAKLALPEAGDQKQSVVGSALSLTSDQMGGKPKQFDMHPMYRFMCTHLLGIPSREQIAQQNVLPPADGPAGQKERRKPAEPGIIQSVGSYASAYIFRALLGGGGPSSVDKDKTPSTALAHLTKTLHSERGPVSPHVDASVRSIMNEPSHPAVGPVNASDGFADLSRGGSSTSLLRQTSSRYSGFSTPVFGRYGNLSAYPAFYSGSGNNALRDGGSRHMLTTEFDPNNVVDPSNIDPGLGFGGVTPRSHSFMRVPFEASDRSSNALIASRRRSFADLTEGITFAMTSANSRPAKQYTNYSVLSVRSSHQIRQDRLREN